MEASVTMSQALRSSEHPDRGPTAPHTPVPIYKPSAPDPYSTPNLISTRIPEFYSLIVPILTVSSQYCRNVCSMYHERSVSLYSRRESLLACFVSG